MRSGVLRPFCVLSLSLSLDKRTRPRRDRLHEEAQHRKHGQPPILDLLDLQLGQGVRVVGQAERVEGPARVQGVARHVVVLDARAPAGKAEALDGPHQQDLDDDGGNDGFSVDEARDPQVLSTLGLEDDGARVVPK